MTIPAVILFSDVPAAQLPVGGISLAVRHIKELYKHGVREFYLCGVSTIPPTLQQARLPGDIVVQSSFFHGHAWYLIITIFFVTSTNAT